MRSCSCTLAGTKACETCPNAMFDRFSDEWENEPPRKVIFREVDPLKSYQDQLVREIEEYAKEKQGNNPFPTVQQEVVEDIIALIKEGK